MSQKDQLDRLESKVDKTIDAVTDISLIVAKMEVHVEKNTFDLADHMKRTELSEARLERLEKVDQWIRGAAWMLSGIAALAYAIAKFLK